MTRGGRMMVNLKEQIIKRRLKQYEVARVMGISEFTLNRWLRDERYLSETKRKAIQKAILEAENNLKI